MPEPDPSLISKTSSTQEVESAQSSTSDTPSQPVGPKKRFPKWLKVAVKLAIGGVVLWAVGQQILMTWDRWQAKTADFGLNITLLVTSGIFYIFGLMAFGIYYARVVQMVAPLISTFTCLKAYILSHPSKYVPGKGMVVVIRVALLTKAGARTTAAILTALYETLSMMAIGGLLGSALLFIPPSHPIGALLSLALGLAFLATVLPFTFGRAVRILKKGLHSIEPGDLPTPTIPDIRALLLWGVLGWLLWGVSQVLVVTALDPHQSVSVSHWPRVMGAMMLGTVGGFALPILPGGIGLREWIIDELTGGLLGPDLAIASALGLRFVWVVAELVAAAVIALVPTPPEPGQKTQESPQV